MISYMVFIKSNSDQYKIYVYELATSTITNPLISRSVVQSYPGLGTNDAKIILNLRFLTRIEVFHIQL
jgi:hypothetical protein